MQSTMTLRKKLVANVADDRRSGDGVTYHLKPGYSLGDAHTIDGDSARYCDDRLAEVKTCECAYCTRRKHN